jgi:hypothetical protein
MADSSGKEPRHFHPAKPLLFTLALLLLLLLLLLPLSPPPLAPSMAALRAAPTAAVAMHTPAPAIVLMGDSVDSFMVSDWCRQHAPSFSLCFDEGYWNGWHPILPSDNCSGYQELLDTLLEPWSKFAGFVICRPNKAAPNNSPTMLSFYNVWGALNRRPPGYEPAPPQEMTLRDIWTPPFALIPRLLGRQPNAFLVQSLYCDLGTEETSSKEDYLKLANEGNSSLLSAWLGRYGSSAGALIDLTADLTKDWPLLFRMWRTSNEVSDAATSGWRKRANGLIRRANAASSESAEKRGVAVFGFLAEGAVPLRDLHHPDEPVSVAAMDCLIADVVRLIGA